MTPFRIDDRRHQRAAARRRARRGVVSLRAAALTLGLGLSLGLGGALSTPAAAASCQPPSYCAQAGACISSREVRSQAQAQAPRGWTVARVRLVGHAPTPTCLWYEVRLQGPNGAGQVVYWSIRGGRAR
ncbi:MAG: hypothetical protein AAGM38_00590 [Pseudomonadota bacterium]